MSPDDRAWVERLIARALRRKGRPGEPGASVDPSFVEALILERVAKAVAAIPAPKDGKDGLAGVDATAKGDRGPRGPKGEKGDDGEPGPAPAHQWDGTKLRFENPDGSWGKKVDLEGPRGPAGYGGGGIVQTGGEFDLDDLPLGDTSTPTQIILKQHGVWARVSWATFLDLIGTAPPSYTPSLDFSDARNSQYIGAVHL